ncbi:MAG: four helix bundle protein [Dokdonella sp.]
MTRPHHELKAWQHAMDLAREVYALTSGFPNDERYGLTSQLRRAAVSVPSNIAEGSARGGLREFIQFMYIARGSMSELDTQLRLADDFGFCDSGRALENVEALFALLGGLITAQRNRADSLQAAKLPTDRPRSGRLSPQ